MKRGSGCSRALALIISLFVITWASAANAKQFVLVHGAWQGAWNWYKVVTILEAAGHTVTLVELPSHGIDSTPPGSVTLQDYTDKVVQSLDAISEPVVLVAHSMGGIAASTAAEARPAKVQKLVYLAAFLIPNGGTMLDVALSDTEALTLPNFIIDFAGGTVDVNRSALRDIYYNTSPATDVSLARSLFKKQALQPAVTPLQLTQENWGSVRRFYIETLQDHAISLSVQRSMYTQTPVEKVYTLDTDHSPFFSAPLKLTAYLLDIANR
jgi:pimeloyl-ACP methyl ester carboxylesterase